MRARLRQLMLKRMFIYAALIALLAYGVHEAIDRMTPIQFDKHTVTGNVMIMDGGLSKQNYPPVLHGLNFLLAPFAKLIAPLNSQQDLMDAVSKETGLDDWGDAQSLVDGLSSIIKSITTGEVTLTPLGRIDVQTTLTNTLKNRLKVEAFWNAHPEIDWAIDVSDPIIISSLPRTGSTMLQNLLAKTDLFRTLKFYEAVAPVVWPEDEEDKREETAGTFLDMVDWYRPLLWDLHEMTPTGPEEDRVLEQLMFSDSIDTFYSGEQYAKHVASLDQVKVLEHTKKMLQILQYQDYRENPTEKPPRWMLKSSPHFGRTEEILKVFPNAQIINLHRSPVDAMKSFATLGLYAAGAIMDPVPLNRANDIMALGMSWLQNWVDFRRKNGEDKEKYIDVQSKHLFSDPETTMLKILEFLKIPDEVSFQVTKDAAKGKVVRRPCKILHMFGKFGMDEMEFRKKYKDLITEYEAMVGLGQGMTYPSAV
ncbi:hypothetical protein TrLO_g1175 [Triparma laevis f. longispina]|uniref:Sulfotransferase n=1 Tax=Triparma laevis f. longispina TaxID=1714387 RepID=A0A9W7L0W0_9STRA|nr:hypothetical protein TrLO_g1175 [Triparma laevis f. longispina]